MTYYDILEISEKASPEVIRMAYKALCKKYHPDVFQGDKRFAEEKMKQINEAYETLSDAAKKRQYDLTINNQTSRTQSTHNEPRRSHSAPKQERTSVNPTELVKLGFKALEAGDWFVAFSHFEIALNQNAGLAEAYLGKLMVELRVKTREGLKDCDTPFYDKMNYKKAFSLADDSLKKFLTETIQHINNRNYETKCRIIYRKACAFMLQNNGIQSFQDAIAEFEKIRGYKDSDNKIKECYQKIAEINSAILAAEAEREKRKKERKEKIIAKFPLFKKVAIFVVPMLILAIVAASILPEIDWNGENLIDSSLDVGTSNITTSENISSEEASSLAHGDGTNKVDSSSFTDVLSPSSKPSYSPPTSTPSTSTSVSSSSNSDKPAIFGSSDDFNITEGDFVFAFHYNEFGPVYVEVTLIEYNGNSSTVKIPSKIKGYSITTIGDHAFEKCSSLVTVEMPDGVREIGNGAFYNCVSLTNILVPDSVVCVGNYAFAGCSSLVSITIPNGVTSIGSSAFCWCSSLSKITLPNSVAYIGEFAFHQCSSLTEFTIPSNVTTISNNIFNDCGSLTEVVIPNGVTVIGEFSFSDCVSLSVIVLPNSVTDIQWGAFARTSLNSVTIPDSVVAMSEQAFMGCKNLKTVYFQSGTQKEKFAEIFDSTVELKVLE